MAKGVYGVTHSPVMTLPAFHRHALAQGVGLPPLAAGYAYVVDEQGRYYVDDSGNYYIVLVS